MYPKHQPLTRLEPTLLMMLSLALAGIGSLLCLPSQSSHAQQDRQLQQTGSTTTNSGKRSALVIGNGAYQKAPPLRNPPNDARDMAVALRELGFDVTSGINTNQRDLKRLVREFGQKIKAGGSGLFYYAGHGVQSKGRNYLIPVDADIQSEAEVEDSAVDVNLVLGYMDEAQNGLNIVILDACRNNPFARSFRSASGGLAQVDAPTGTLIAYATAPGRVASDGTGQNGLYTSELLKQMRVPGLSATDMFMRVRAEIMKQTGSKQVPWEASSLVGAFYFSGQPTTASAGTANNTSAKSNVDPAAFELTYWDSIKNSKDPADFKSYLDQYPTGKFASLARNRLKTLEAPAGSTNATNNPSSPKVGGLIGGILNSSSGCFGTDAGAASTDWNSHYTWAQKQTSGRLKAGLEDKLGAVFRCSAKTDAQVFDLFADVSVVIARYVPNAACFNGDGGAVAPDPSGHRDWAREKGRMVALDNLKAKAAAALDCLEGSKRASYYADVSVLAAGGALK